MTWYGYHRAKGLARSGMNGGRKPLLREEAGTQQNGSVARMVAGGQEGHRGLMDPLRSGTRGSDGRMPAGSAINRQFSAHEDFASSHVLAHAAPIGITPIGVFCWALSHKITKIPGCTCSGRRVSCRARRKPHAVQCDPSRGRTDRSLSSACLTPKMDSFSCRPPRNAAAR